MDFMRDTLADGRVFRPLNIVDDYTRECLAIEVDTSLPGARVVRVLDRRAALGRQPLHIGVANGPEFASKAVDQWAARRGVSLRFIEAGKPMQNGYIESFNGKFRAECLSQYWFIRLEEARSVSEQVARGLQRAAAASKAATANAGRVRGETLRLQTGSTLVMIAPLLGWRSAS
jgi:putative transposase